MKKALQIRQGQFLTLHCEAPVNDALWRSMEPLAFRPCPDHQADTIGWHPLGEDERTLHRTCGETIWLLVAIEKRLLPPSAVQQLHQRRIEDLEADGTELTSREKTSLKDEIIKELLPQALTERTYIPVLVNLQQNWLFIAHRQPNRVKRIRALLSKTFLPWDISASPLNQNIPHILTSWLLQGAPEPFSLTKRCELYSMHDRHSRIAIRHTELELNEIQQCVAASRQVSHLGLSWRDLCQFTLHDDGTLAQIKWQNDEEENPLAETVIVDYMTHSTTALYQDLMTHFGRNTTTN